MAAWVLWSGWAAVPPVCVFDPRLDDGVHHENGLINRMLRGLELQRGEKHAAAGPPCGIGQRHRASPEEHGDSQGTGGWGCQQAATEYATWLVRG